mgnify:CR=1 FL=1
MKKIGLIGAMDEEVAMLKEKLTEVQVETKAAMDFYKGKLEGKDKSRHDFCGRRFLRTQNRCRCKWNWQG